MDKTQSCQSIIMKLKEKEYPTISTYSYNKIKRSNSNHV